MGTSAPTVSLCGTALPRSTAVAADKGRALSPFKALSQPGQESSVQLEAWIHAAPENPDAFYQQSISPLHLLNCGSDADIKQQAD